VPRLHNVLEKVPHGIEEVLTKALAKKPQDRYATAGEFAEAVNGAARSILSRRARRHLTAGDLNDALDALDDLDTQH
jgi:hypothetical protein